MASLKTPTQINKYWQRLKVKSLKCWYQPSTHNIPHIFTVLVYIGRKYQFNREREFLGSSNTRFGTMYWNLYLIFKKIYIRNLALSNDLKFSCNSITLLIWVAITLLFNKWSAKSMIVSWNRVAYKSF